MTETPELTEQQRTVLLALPDDSPRWFGTINDALQDVPSADVRARLVELQELGLAQFHSGYGWMASLAGIVLRGQWAPKFWVLVIEWDSGEDLTIELHATKRSAQLSAARIVVDAPEGAVEGWPEEQAPPLADDVDQLVLDAWLEEFHDLNTVPWVTISENEVQS